jgi:hypothetical protein
VIKFRKKKMGGVCGTYGEEEYIQGLWDETRRKDFIGASHRLEDNTKMNLKEIGWQDMD